MIGYHIRTIAYRNLARASLRLFPLQGPVVQHAIVSQCQVPGFVCHKTTWAGITDPTHAPDPDSLTVNLWFEVYPSIYIVRYDPYMYVQDTDCMK